MVRYHGDGKVYAMKVLGKVSCLNVFQQKQYSQKEHIKRRNEVKHVMAERNVLLNNINHPFLVSLHYSFQTKDKLYFVLDFLNGGEVPNCPFIYPFINLLFLFFSSFSIFKRSVALPSPGRVSTLPRLPVPLAICTTRTSFIGI
jgi:serine/threonine protein kinase